MDATAAPGPLATLVRRIIGFTVGLLLLTSPATAAQMWQLKADQTTLFHELYLKVWSYLADGPSMVAYAGPPYTAALDEVLGGVCPDYPTLARIESLDAIGDPTNPPDPDSFPTGSDYDIQLCEDVEVATGAHVLFATHVGGQLIAMRLDDVALTAFDGADAEAILDAIEALKTTK